MTPLHETNREYANERFSSFVSVFPLDTIGFLNKVTAIHCLAYYLEDELVLAVLVRFAGGKYTVIANETVPKKFKLLGFPNTKEEIMLFNTCFRKLMELMFLEPLNVKIKPTTNSLTDEKIETFKQEGIVIC